MRKIALRCFAIALAQTNLAPQTADAQELREKLCILWSAERLPKIPSATIISTAIKPSEKITTIARTTRGIFDATPALRYMNTIGVVDYNTEQEIKRAYASGSFSRAEQIISAFAMVNIAATYRVEISLKFASTEASLGFDCSVSNQGNAHITDTGLIR